MAEILNIPGIRGWDTAQAQARSRNQAETQEIGQALGLAGQAMSLQDAFRKRGEEEQLKELFRSSGGDLTKMRDSAFSSGNYRVGMDIDKQLRAQSKEDLDNRYKLGQIGDQDRKRIEAANDAMAAAYEHPYTIYKSLRDKDVPEPMARSQAQAAWEAARSSAAGNPILGNMRLPDQFDPDNAIAQLATTKRTKDVFDRFHKEATLAETAKRHDQQKTNEEAQRRIAGGHLGVAQANLGVSQGNLELNALRSLHRTPISEVVNGVPQTNFRDQLGNTWDREGKLMAGPGIPPQLRRYAPQGASGTAPQASQGTMPSIMDQGAQGQAQPQAQSPSAPTFAPMPRGGGAHRFSETVDPNTGMKSITVLDQGGNIIKKTDLGGIAPGMVSRYGTIGMKVGNDLEKDIRPHSQILDLVSRYAEARQTSDNSQTNTVLAQLLNQMARTNANKLKGDMDRILGAGPMGASLPARIENYLSQVSTGTRSAETMQNMDRLVDAIYDSSTSRIRDGLDNATSKMRAQSLNPATIVTPRVFGNIVIYPTIGRVRYRSAQERDADIQKYQESQKDTK